MDFPTMSQDRLEEIVAKFSSCRIAIVGDFFLDKYLDVDPAWEEPSLETGKPAHQVAGVRIFPGAAGTVVSNLHALGAGELHAVGFTGDDGEGFELRRCLDRLDCRTEHLIIGSERRTPTYLKPRDINRPGLEGEHSRYDTKNRQPTPSTIEKSLIGSLEELIPRVDAVILLDQVDEENCGAITTQVREAVCEIAERHPQVTFWADSRRNIRKFRNVIIKPNQFEAMASSGRNHEAEIPLKQLTDEALKLRRVTKRPVFVTLGHRGLLVADREGTLIPAVSVKGPIDPTGAGDSLTAGCVLALSSGANLIEAGVIGNLVASLTVTQLATTGTAQPSQLPGQLETWLGQIGARAD